MKVVTRHVWQDAKEQVTGYRLSERGKRIYARRKETVERSFADAKELHGHRYARMRGLVRVQEQAYLAAAAQNIKKIAMWMDKLLRTGPQAPKGEKSLLVRHMRTLWRWLVNAYQPIRPKWV